MYSTSYHFVYFIVFVAGVLFLIKFLGNYMIKEPVVTEGVTFTYVSQLPNGDYETLFSLDPRHIMLVQKGRFGGKERIFCIHEYEMMKEKDGAFIKNFTKMGDVIIPLQSAEAKAAS